MNKKTIVVGMLSLAIGFSIGLNVNLMKDNKFVKDNIIVDNKVNDKINDKINNDKVIEEILENSKHKNKRLIDVDKIINVRFYDQNLKVVEGKFDIVFTSESMSIEPITGPPYNNDKIFTIRRISK